MNTAFAFRINRIKYYIPIFLASLCLNASAQFFHYPFPPTKADYAKNIAAQVKIGYEYKLTGDEKSLNRVLEYGSQGLPVVLYEKGTNDNGDSITIATSYYKYAAGKLIQKEVVNHQGDDSYKIGYTYNTAGKLLKKVVVQIDPPTYTYVYDKLGRAIKATIKVRMPDENGKPVDIPRGRYDYKYDTAGKLVQETLYSQDNEKQFTIKWQYNNQGQPIKVIGLDSQDQLVYEELLEYGENHLLSKRTTNKPDEEATVFVYEYCINCKQSWMK